jgi:LacI family fructose operon transcriptional repressor
MPQHRKSLEEIARLAGVSKTLVSLVISGKAVQYRIHPKTIRRVQSIVKKQGYYPNQYAQGLRLKKTRTIGLVVGDITNRFFSLLEKSIEAAAYQSGFNLIIASSEDNAKKEETVFTNLLSKSVDAVIMASVMPDNRLHSRLNRGNTPVVYVDRKVRGRNTACIVSNNFKGAQALTGRFIAQGLRHIAFIGGVPEFATHIERLQGYKSALKKYNIPVRPNLVSHGYFTPESGYKQVSRFLSRKNSVQAIFTASYTLFEGLLLYIREKGFESVKQVRLGTFDDHPVLDLLPIRVDSVKQDADTMGKTAFNLALSVLEGRKGIKGKVLDTELIIRSEP